MENFGSLKVGKAYTKKMDAPNAPNPANPNVQNPADQNQDQNQDQVPVGQVPAQVPVQPVPQLGPVQPWPLLYLHPFLRFSIKIGYERNWNFQVSQKRMQNPISLVRETGWRCIISQKERR